MRLGDDGFGHGHDNHPNGQWVAMGPAMLAVGIMLVGCFVTFLLLSFDAMRPRIGDIVVFRPNTVEQDAWRIQVPVYRPTAAGQTSCLMDPAVMTRQGGSLVVEARDDANTAAQYRLHWAGAHTADGAGDCSGSADLAVSRVELQKLANAAGGFGVIRRRL